MNTIFKYSSIKNIENIKYQLSKEKNDPNIDINRKHIIERSETFIKLAKFSSRAYCFFEFALLINAIVNRKPNMPLRTTFMLVRIYSFWVLTNIITNVYLDKQIQALKLTNNNGFMKYIFNRS
jgi:hypothetical protein